MVLIEGVIAPMVAEIRKLSVKTPVFREIDGSPV
jgi:hypothetical protein